MNSSAPNSSRVARIAWLVLVSLYLAAFIAGVHFSIKWVERPREHVS